MVEIGQMSRLNVRCLPIYTHSVELYINNRILNTRFIKVDPNDCKMPLKFKIVTIKLYVIIYRINKIVLVRKA